MSLLTLNPQLLPNEVTREMLDDIEALAVARVLSYLNGTHLLGDLQGGGIQLRVVFSNPHEGYSHASAQYLPSPPSVGVNGGASI